MPDKQEQNRPETEPDEEPRPAPGPVEQEPPEPSPADQDPEPLAVDAEPEAPPPEAPDVEPQPVEVPDEEPKPVELAEEEPKPIDMPDEEPEPDPRLVEVIKEHDRRVASLEHDLAEVMANLPQARPDDFFARSEPAPDPHQMVRPVGIRGGDGIDALFTPDGGSMSAVQPFTPFTSIPISENIEWGIAAIPANRPGDDNCAWMRPTEDGHYAYCYVQPYAAPTSHEWGFPTMPEVSEENEKGFVKVVFWGQGYGRPGEPNVRGGELVPFMRVGAIALGVGFPDAPIGKVGWAFAPTLLATAPEGWIWMEDGETHYLPNPSVTVLGAEFVNTDVRQTLAVGAGDQDLPPADPAEEFPYAHDQGSVEPATKYTYLPPNGVPVIYYDVYGSYHKLMQRIN